MLNIFVFWVLENVKTFLLFNKSFESTRKILHIPAPSRQLISWNRVLILTTLKVLWNCKFWECLKNYILGIFRHEACAACVKDYYRNIQKIFKLFFPSVEISSDEFWIYIFSADAQRLKRMTRRKTFHRLHDTVTLLTVRHFKIHDKDDLSSGPTLTTWSQLKMTNCSRAGQGSSSFVSALE